MRVELFAHKNSDARSVARFINCIPEPAWIYDDATRRLKAVNDAAVARYGYDRQRFLTLTAEVFRLPEGFQKKGSGEAFGGQASTVFKSERHVLSNGETIRVTVSETPASFGDRPSTLVISREDAGERKEAGRSEEAGNDLFMQLAESMPQRVWTANALGEVDFGNARYYDYIGEDREAFDLARWPEYVHPDDVESAKAMWAERLRTGEVFATEFRIRNKEGAYRWHYVTATPIRNERGAVSRWLGSCIDIHDRKEADEKVRASRDLLHSTLDHISDGFYALDKSWRFTFVNRAAEAILGKSRDDLIGKTLWEVADKNMEQTFDGHYRLAMETQETVKFAYYSQQLGAFLELTAYPSPDRLAVTFRDITAQANAETHLSLFESCFARLNDIIIIAQVNPQNPARPRIVFVNDAFVRHTGFSREEAIGKSFDMLHGEGTARSDIGEIENAFQSCRPVRVEMLNYKKNGRPFQTEIDIVLVQRERGGVNHFVSIQRDITERYVAAKRLEESEARFKAAAGAATDVIWDWDINAGVMWWSEGYERTFGHPLPQGPAGVDSWVDYIHPEDRERVEAGINKAIEDKSEYWEDYYRFLHRDGRILSVYDRGYQIFDDDGEPFRFVGGMSDITEREQARIAMKTFAERLMRQVEAMREITHATDRDDHEFLSRIVRASQNLFEADGAAFVAPKEEEFEIRIAEGMLADKRGVRMRREGSLLGHALLSHEAIICDDALIDDRTNKVLTRETGTRSLMAVSLQGPDGPVGVIEVMSNRPQAFDGNDARIMTLHAQSCSPVFQRRQVEERLRRAQRLEAVGQLTGGVAHDFNNLLTVILGNAEILTERLKDDPEASWLARMSQTAAERGAELTNRLLAFARQQPLDPKSTDVNQLVGGMEGLLRRTLGEHVEVQIILCKGAWSALIDAPQLESAILNLSLNARDSMPDGGKLIIEIENAHLSEGYAQSEDEVKAGDYIMIAVSDTGSGMPPDVARRVFEPFFTTKGAGKGSGLGLSMVYGFVKQSRGHIKIYSEVSQGTTVKLYLPRAGAFEKESAAEVPAASGGTEKVLFVEDDDLVRGHVLAQLRLLGYEVVETRNAREALEAARRIDDFDLLFTDVVMPGGMTGRQLADAIRETRPNIKVLYTSGYTENAIVHHGRLDAGVHFISKPFRQADLDKKIRNTLEGPA